MGLFYFLFLCPERSRLPNRFNTSQIAHRTPEQKKQTTDAVLNRSTIDEQKEMIMTIKAAIKSVYAILLITAAACFSAEVTIAWDPSLTTTTGTPLNDVDHYNLYYSESPSEFTDYVEVNTGTSAQIDNLEYNKQYFFAVKACTDTAESDFSETLAWNAPEMPDTDSDGISDEWETSHFFNLQIANSTTDSDNNGTSDLNEFVAGTDPLNPADQPAITIEDGNQVSFQARTATGTGYQNRARSYSLLFCDNLSAGTWVPVTGMENIAANDQVISYEPAANSLSGYYRTEILLN